MASDVGALFSWILELFMYEVTIYKKSSPK